MLESIVVGAIAANCWIISTQREIDGRQECVVIDPGGDPAAIITRLRKGHLHPSLILLTHGHFDHLAALPELVEAFSKESSAIPINVAIHSSDASYLGPDSRPNHRRDFAQAGAVAYVDELWSEMPRPTRLLSDGDRVGPFRVLHVPGHTPGSISFLDEAGGHLFSGDTLFASGVGRTDLPGGDEAALGLSLERLLSLDGSIRVHPGHGPDTTIARERQNFL